jgi:hypothetical protein
VSFTFSLARLVRQRFPVLRHLEKQVARLAALGSRPLAIVGRFI